MCAQGQNTLAGTSFKSFIKQMQQCVPALNLTDDKGSSADHESSLPRCLSYKQMNPGRRGPRLEYKSALTVQLTIV